MKMHGRKVALFISVSIVVSAWTQRKTASSLCRCRMRSAEPLLCLGVLTLYRSQNAALA